MCSRSPAELEPGDEIGGLHDFNHEDSRSDGVRHAAGNEKDVTGFDRHRFEQPQHLFEILGFDDALEPLPAYRVLKTEIQTGFDPLAVPEDDITLRFAGIRIQMLPRKFDRGVALQLEPDRRVEELQQKSGFFPEALKMFAPEQKLRIPSYEFGECDRFSVEFEKRDAFRRPARIDCGRVGEQPVLREMRILRRNRFRRVRRASFRPDRCARRGWAESGRAAGAVCERGRAWYDSFCCIS